MYNDVGAAHFASGTAAPAALRVALGLDEGPVFRTVARLSPEKGLDILLEATRLVLVGMPSARLLVVGDGPELAALRMRAANLGIDHTVRFLGVRADVAALNQLLDVFVLPSREEACPIALLEAMAGARPVIATRVGGSSELISHDADGVLVRPDDAPALASAVLALLQDAPRRAALGAAAHRTATAQFTLEQMIERTLAVYRRLLREIDADREGPRATSRERSASP